MRVYIVTDKDLDRLLAEIDRDPAYGVSGGSSTDVTKEQLEAHREAHRFFNYVIRRWVFSVMGEASSGSS